MTLYSADTFNRADQTPLGATDGAGTLDPLTWTTQAGTCDILTNQARASVVVGIATVESSVADIDITLTYSTLANGSGLLFRFSDTSNYWYVRNQTGNINLRKIVGGVASDVGSSFASSNGDIIRVVANGTAVSFYQNGTLRTSTTDSFNSTATKHGFTAGNSAARFDDWSAESVSAPPTTPQELTATETQTASISAILQFGKELTATETQTPTITVVLSLGKELSVTQTQTPTLEFDLSSTRTLSVTQTQTPTLTAVTARSKVLTATQTQTPVISKAPSNAPAPTVSTVTPISGTTAGGTAVVIAGTNFGGTTAVKFGTTNAASFNLASDEQLAAVSPAHSAGTVPVIVTTPAGSSG